MFHCEHSGFFEAHGVEILLVGNIRTFKFREPGYGWVFGQSTAILREIVLLIRLVEVEVLAAQKVLLGFHLNTLLVYPLILIDSSDLALEVIYFLIQRLNFIGKTLLTGDDFVLGGPVHSVYLCAQLRNRLTVPQFLQVGGEGFHIKLEVELEAGDDRWHIVELIKFIGEVLVYKRIANVLLFKFADQFWDWLPFVHHLY